ncbi:MAG: ribokinase [Hyphomicrobiaceae bacterium]
MISVFGSVNMDLTFQLAALPSLGETVLTPEFSEAVGGKGANQAIAAARDGAATQFTGCVGDDALGATVRSALQAEGINLEALTTVAGKTALASIWVDVRGDNMIAVASGANAKVTAEMLALQALNRETLVVLQMEVPASEIEAVISKAKQNGTKVLLNLAPALPISMGALQQLDILVLNEHEASTLCEQLKFAAATPDEQIVGLTRLLDASVIITLGAEGVVAMHKGQTFQVPALAIEPVDTTGAGDCFVGVFAAGLDAGLSFENALARAAVAGSLACTVVGAMPSFPTRDLIDQAMAQCS